MTAVADVIEYLKTLDPNEEVLWQVFTRNHLGDMDEETWNDFVNGIDGQFGDEVSFLVSELYENYEPEEDEDDEDDEI